jgi:hypothetical protein
MALNPEVRQGRYGEAFVKTIATAAGLTAQKLEEDDYLIDLMVGHPGGRGGLISPMIGVQVKSTRKARVSGGTVTYGLKSKYYNELAKPAVEWSLPTFLVVVLVPDEPDKWADVTDERLLLRRAGYWKCLHGEPLRRDLHPDSDVKVSVPRANLLSESAFLQMFDLAEQLQMEGRGVQIL